MSNPDIPIRDDTGPADAPAPRTNGTEQQEQPLVDPETLADYAEFQAFKKAQAEKVKVEDTPTSIELEVSGEIRKYELVDLDQDVVAHLSVLTTFADNDAERAVALFESLLTPDDFDRLRADIKPAMRQARRKMLVDPDAPSISDIWTTMAKTVMEPLQELIADPKRAGSLGGQSRTGPKSKPASIRSAIPSIE